jgi:hypothetical protein
MKQKIHLCKLGYSIYNNRNCFRLSNKKSYNIYIYKYYRKFSKLNNFIEYYTVYFNSFIFFDFTKFYSF